MNVGLPAVHVGSGYMEFREARVGDAGAIAMLHAESWRQHYRGAYLDTFLDGEVFADRRAVWSDRLAHPANRYTVVAQQDGALVGFAHLIFDDDPRWGALLENVQVAHDLKRRGVGKRLMTEAAVVLRERRPCSELFLWVLEQNTSAQAFYLALGGVIAGRELRGPFPGGGTALGRRVSWPDPSVLTQSDDGRQRGDGADVYIRPAGSADLVQLISLYEQLADRRTDARPPTESLVRTRFADIARQPGRVLLVAERDQRVLGAADLVVSANLTHRGDPWAIVENVIVDQAERRKGVGRALMTDIVRRCDEAGCYKIQLLSRKHRREAHAFYARLGFDAVAEGFRRYLS
jgi:ribosomal protein S18 acetylase RimI-like enzyme